MKKFGQARVGDACIPWSAAVGGSLVNNLVVALITAAGVTSLFVIVHVWQGRKFRGKHSFYDGELSADALIRMAEPSIELDKATYRELQARLHAHQQRREQAKMPPPVSIDRPGRHRLCEPHGEPSVMLLAGEPTLFCGAYGGDQ